MPKIGEFASSIRARSSSKLRSASVCVLVYSSSFCSSCRMRSRCSAMIVLGSAASSPLAADIARGPRPVPHGSRCPFVLPWKKVASPLENNTNRRLWSDEHPFPVPKVVKIYEIDKFRGNLENLSCDPESLKGGPLCRSSRRSASGRFTTFGPYGTKSAVHRPK